MSGIGAPGCQRELDLGFRRPGLQQLDHVAHHLVDVGRGSGPARAPC